MGTYIDLRVLLWPYRDPWGPLGTYRDVWGPMGAYGGL